MTTTLLAGAFVALLTVTGCTTITPALVASTSAEPDLPALVTEPSGPHGVVVPTAPVQTMIDPFVLSDGTPRIVAVARYHIQARVLSTEPYWFDEEAPWQPLDVALGWQSMSATSVLRNLIITQGHRFDRLLVAMVHPPLRTMITQSSNNHLIPTTPAIRDAMNHLRRGQVVTIDGYLVNVRHRDWEWFTSLSREDVGAGACEIIAVTTLTWQRTDPLTMVPPNEHH